MNDQPIRYAVIGQGHFAQSAVLPAFAAAKGSALTAIFSGDPEKRAALAEEYGRATVRGYEELDAYLDSGAVDAVYIALPNAMHRDFVIRAARMGVHVLCEKPMAASVAQCEEMIAACRDASVKLMIAYRLHFEPGNLAMVDLVQSGRLGRVRALNGVFSMPVADANVRLAREQAGGPLNDIGIYCINAARYLFRDEPTEVTALRATASDDPRFGEVPEQYGIVLRFPNERLATFTVSFSGAHSGHYEIIGSKGTARMDPAFTHSEPLAYEIRIGDKKPERTELKRTDQVAAEIVYFSDCIRRDVEPEPSGAEGLADMRVIEALERSATLGEAIRLPYTGRDQRPDGSQAMSIKLHREADVVKVEPPSRS